MNLVIVGPVLDLLISSCMVDSYGRRFATSKNVNCYSWGQCWTYLFHHASRTHFMGAVGDQKECPLLFTGPVMDLPISSCITDTCYGHCL